MSRRFASLKTPAPFSRDAGEAERQAPLCRVAGEGQTQAPLSRHAGEGSGVRAVEPNAGGLHSTRTQSAPNAPSPGRFAATLSRKREREALRAGKSAGFTMVELLVTVTIIAMLAALVLGAVQMARESAREINTRSLIAKLDRFVSARYESYTSRRLPLSRQDIIDVATNRGWPLTAPWTVPRVKLNAMRDLMRMEMPDRWSDVTDGPVFLRFYPRDPDPAQDRLKWLVDPALRERYKQAYDSAPAVPARNEWGGAECLYQIVMSCPGAKDQFRDTDMGDIDGDGLREFHDGWGRPIQFIRWPAGFVDYANLQAHNNGIAPAGCAGYSPLPWSPPSGRQTGDPATQPDPFDATRVISRLVDAGGLPERARGYLLYPLIYSAGPDGRPDLNVGTAYVLTPDQDLNPYWPDGNSDLSADECRFVGQPLDGGVNVTGVPQESANDSLDHYDNIHKVACQVPVDTDGKRGQEPFA